jgi:hypothetical protein
MEEIDDLKLKLFGGRPVKANGYGNIIPLKVENVIDVGYSEYMKFLNILTLDAKDFLQEGSTNDTHVFDLLVSYGGEEILTIFEQALSFFLGGEAMSDKDELRVFIKIDDNDIRIVNKDNYYEIQEVIKWQNYINNFEEKRINSNFNPADEETRKLKERMDNLAKQREELKRKQSANGEEDDSNNVEFFDILDAISSKSYGISELNVLHLSIYQVYRKFKRLEIIEQYDISIKSILAGAKNIKLKHWSSKA